MNLTPGSAGEMITLTDKKCMTSDEWANGAGADWAERNPKTVEEIDAIWLRHWGRLRTELAREILAPVPHDSSVLEVGTASGVQLSLLASIGFTDLSGCDISAGAMKENLFPCRVADICDLPYADDSFDMLMTSGCLMHTHPDDRDRAIRELLRVSKRWVWTSEYWNEDGVWPFHWINGLIPPLWTDDWEQRFLSVNPRLDTVGRIGLNHTGTGSPIEVLLMGQNG